MASDLENSCCEITTENMRVKTYAKPSSSKKKPRASNSKQSRKKGKVSSKSYSDSLSEEDEVASDIENDGDC